MDLWGAAAGFVKVIAAIRVLSTAHWLFPLMMIANLVPESYKYDTYTSAIPTAPIPGKEGRGWSLSRIV